MSERKTSEIKLRVTPSFKAAVQLAAEQAGETMSVYIESASQDRMNAPAAVSATGYSLVGEPQIGPSLDMFRGSAISAEIEWVAPFTPVAQPVPAKDADGSCAKNCHHWEWCECKQLRRD